MKSIVKYGLFASALSIAAFVGHIITSYSYKEQSYRDSFAQQNKQSTEVEAILGVNRVESSEQISAKQISHPEAVSSLERVNSPEPAERAKYPEQAKSPAPNNKLDPIAAEQAAKAQALREQAAREKAAKDKAIQAAAKTPATQSPEASKKAAGEIGSQQDTAASRNSPPTDNTASGSTDLASGSGMPRGPLPGVSSNSSGDMLAILAPLLKLTDGQPLGAEPIEGRALLIVVWASWCAGCNDQFFALEAFKNKLANPNLDMIVVAMDENLDDARKALARRQINSQVVIGTEQFLKQVQLVGMPSSYFADSQGRWQVSVLGDSSQDFATFEQKIRSILAESRANPEKPAAVVNLAKGEGGVGL